MKNYYEEKAKLPKVKEIKEACLEILSPSTTYKREKILGLLQQHFGLTKAQIDLRQAENTSTTRVVDGRLTHALDRLEKEGSINHEEKGYWRLI